jgi:hypothetical protein
MTCYIVSFQVNSKESLTELRELLKSYGSYCPINDTLWAIISDKTAADIVSHLRTALQANDRLFVIRSGTQASWLNTYGEENTTWLKKHL